MELIKDIFIFSLYSLPATGETGSNFSKVTRTIHCPEVESVQRRVSGTVLMVLGSLGCSANLLVILLILTESGPSGLGLLVHQCVVDCARASLLFPLGWSLLTCQHVVPKCSGKYFTWKLRKALKGNGII